MALSNSINSNCCYFDATPTPNLQRNPTPAITPTPTKN